MDNKTTGFFFRVAKAMFPRRAFYLWLSETPGRINDGQFEVRDLDRTGNGGVTTQQNASA